MVAGLIGALTVQLLGPPLAMGLAIWTLRTTEPVMPAADYPWLLHGALLMMAFFGYRLGLRRPGPGPALLLHGSAIASALLPVLALYRLWGRT